MKKIIVIVISGFCILVTLITLYFAKTISAEFLESEPFKVVLQEISKIDSIGYIDESQIGTLIGGTLTNENADFNFKIKVPSGTLVVHTALNRNTDKEWQVINMKIRKK